MSEHNATPAQHTQIEKFAVYAIPDAQISCMHFESTGDLGSVISESDLTDTHKIAAEESQVLVRLNPDNEDFAIVYVDASFELEHDDVAAIDRAVEMLGAARRQLLAMNERGAA